MGVLIPKTPPHDSLFTSHRSRVVLVAATALRATAASVSGVLNLGASHGADVDTFAVEVMKLEARRTLLVGPARRGFYPVASVGTDKDRLPDNVVGGMAVGAQSQRCFNFFARCWAVERRLRTHVSNHGAVITDPMIP